VLQTAAIAAGGLAAGPLGRVAAAADKVVPQGEMTLAWHTNIGRLGSTPASMTAAPQPTASSTHCTTP
jgi:hypothetical protein